MDTEIKQVLDLILSKIDRMETEIKKDLQEVKKEQQEMKKEQQEFKKELQEFKKELQEVKKEQISMKASIEALSVRQDEIYQVVRALEEHARVGKAEQDQMKYTVVDLQGRMAKSEEKITDHEIVIQQIRAIN